MASQPRPKYRIYLAPYRIIYWPILLPVALLLGLFNKISPVPIRIYAIRVDRVGQMIGNQEEFLCELELKMRPKEYRVFIYRDYPSNRVILDMLKRVMRINNLFLPLFDVCQKLGGLGVSSMELCGLPGSDRKHLVSRTKQHFNFSESEIREARKQCMELGIDPDKSFVSVLARDNTYLKFIEEPTDLDSYRNVDLDTFIPALEYLADRHKVIRLGSVVKGPLNSNHPNILDYSLSGQRTELLDVYLSAACRFFLSTGTGLDGIASVAFRHPVLYVDFMPINEAPIMKAGCIFIPKKYWLVREERYLTLSELFETGAARMYTPRQLDPMGIVVYDNTPEEILEAVREMEGRLDGTWVDTDDDIELQERFWKYFRAQSKDNVCVGRIGTDFLRANSYLTE